MAIDARALWEEVKERNRRWAACPRHFFPHQPDGYRLGVKIACQHCGVEAGLREIGEYIRGYIAAGGDPTDVMPDWKVEN